MKKFKVFIGILLSLSIAVLGIWIMDGYQLYKQAWENSPSANLTLENISPTFHLVARSHYEPSLLKNKLISTTNHKLLNMEYVRQGQFHLRALRLYGYIHLLVSKDEALSRVLNDGYYGYRSDDRKVGLTAASQYFLTKEPKDLNLADSALLIGLEGSDTLPLKDNFSEISMRVRNSVIDQLMAKGAVSAQEAEAAKATAFTYPVHNSDSK